MSHSILSNVYYTFVKCLFYIIRYVKCIIIFFGSKTYSVFVKCLFHFVKGILHIAKCLFHTNIHPTCYRYDNYCTSVQDLLAEIFEAGFSLLHLVKEWVKLGQRQLCNIETQYSCRSECFKYAHCVHTRSYDLCFYTLRIMESHYFQATFSILHVHDRWW